MDADARLDVDARYLSAAATYAPAIERLARGYEADPDLRRDLVQDVHAALWRSFAGFDGRCSERTWVYRVAHNTAVEHVRARRRWQAERLVELDAAGAIANEENVESLVDARRTVSRLAALIRRLKETDRQVLLLYLEDLPSREIAEITGLTPGAVAVRVHRVKALIADHFVPKESS